MHTKQLYELLRERGVDLAAQQVTLMRHKDERYPLHKYVGTKALTLYQAMQPRRHEPGGLIVGFYGHRPNHGLLLGVSRIKEGCVGPDEALQEGLLAGSFEPSLERWDGYYHELEETNLLGGLRLKLEIYWGKSDIVWRRILKPTDSYPISVTTEPAVPFEGVGRVSLVMAELRIALQDIIWQQELRAIAGIYLITDERSGRHYIGSASGGGGLWQRWSDYASTGHGGNLDLIKLLLEFPGRENDLRLTLLEAMPLSTSRTQVVDRENFWKIALGSRHFGHNRN